jgi:outer membrane protein assembly factor BamB
MASVSRSCFGIAAVVSAVALHAGAGTQGGANLTTYHYDNLRTGWNQAETVLNAANVASSSFGLQQQVALDEQVDAQPLFLSNQTIAGGQYDVVYVATENNTLYAIDASSGQILLSQNFGAPVPGNYSPPL